MLALICWASLVAALVNDIIGCEAGPNCRSRNRRNCQSPMFSCGECLPGFNGLQHNSNEPCYVSISESRSLGGGEVIEIDFSRWVSGSNLQKDYIVNKIRDALMWGSGFFYLKNHGIPKWLISMMFKEVESFFKQPIDIKKSTSARIDAADNSGYIVLGQEGLDENEVRKHPREAYEMNLDHLRSSIWNTTAAIEYWEMFHKLATEVLQLYAKVLYLKDEDLFTNSHNEEWHILRFMHYPPQEVIEKYDFSQKWAGAYSDDGSITLLVQDDIEGLELFDRYLQDWFPVPPRDGTIVVNTGDLLMRWTNDRLVSTLHRVADLFGYNGTKSRYSISFFVQPNKNWVIDSKDILPEETRIYKPITSIDYMVQRSESIYFKQENLNNKAQVLKDKVDHQDL